MALSDRAAMLSMSHAHLLNAKQCLQRPTTRSIYVLGFQARGSGRGVHDAQPLSMQNGKTPAAIAMGISDCILRILRLNMVCIIHEYRHHLSLQETTMLLCNGLHLGIATHARMKQQW